MSAAKSSKTILAHNLNKLMAGRPSLKSNPKMVAASGLGLGTIQRTRNAESAATVDTLDALAKVFDVPPWELLVADMDQVPPQGKEKPQLSSAAIEIGQLFDLLTDRIERTVAQNEATSAILRVLSERETRPTDAPAPVVSSKKQRA